MYRSEIFLYFLQLVAFRLWFRLASNIVRSKDLDRPLAEVLYEEFYKKRGLLVVYYSDTALAQKLGVNKRTIRRMKKELIDGGFMRIEKITWRGKDFECFVMGEVQECGEVLYAFDICARGYREIPQKCYYYWPSYIVNDKDFLTFMGLPEFVLWFFLTANIFRGTFKLKFPNMLRKDFYDERNLLVAYYPDKMIAEKLNLSRSTVKNMRRSLIKKNLIKIERHYYLRQLRPVYVLGCRKAIGGKTVEVLDLFESKREISAPKKEVEDFCVEDESLEEILLRKFPGKLRTNLTPRPGQI